MFSKVYGSAVYGIDGSLVTAEADVSDGLPNFLLVGYLASEVKEAKERVRVSIKNAGYRLPVKKITVNLSPADRRKEGTGFDLPIAVAVLTAFGYVSQESLEDVVFAGELSLNGRVNAIHGILPIILAAKKAGKKRCVIPCANETEGNMVSGIQVIGVNSLRETIDYLNGKRQLMAAVQGKKTAAAKAGGKMTDGEEKKDFSDVIGQETVKRAVEIAVAGMHNILIMGPPGAGKSMIASRIPTIMPKLSLEEQIEIAKVYSVAGLLEEGNFPDSRPFRAPHHTITATAMTGGGRIPVPGEISLATKGVLFLDEFPEFDRRALETLRQPLEERRIHVARLQAAYHYPADFMLVAAMNPCQCGYYPDRSRCRCSRNMIRQYLGKVSRPLLDRIDICVEASAMRYRQLASHAKGESSDCIRKRIEAAGIRQRKRYRKERILCNAMLSTGMIDKYCVLDEESRDYLETMYAKYDWSARIYHRILKVARTIADLEGSGCIQAMHLQEAVCYRGADLQYWREFE